MRCPKSAVYGVLFLVKQHNIFFAVSLKYKNCFSKLTSRSWTYLGYLLSGRLLIRSDRVFFGDLQVGQ